MIVLRPHCASGGSRGHLPAVWKNRQIYSLAPGTSVAMHSFTLTRQPPTLSTLLLLFLALPEGEENTIEPSQTRVRVIMLTLAVFQLN